MTVDHPLPSNPCDGPDPKHECSPPPLLPPPSLHPPPPPTSSSAASHGRSTFVTALVIAGSVLAFLALCLSVFLLARRWRRRWRRRQREALLEAALAPAAAPPDGGAGLNPAGEEVVHHAWHIRTVGLDEAAIESIALTRYRAGGALGASDCTVCLGEFQDGELLRLLPKCAHAFHVQCIDTWLRAHVSCPLCRASVTDPAAEQPDPPTPPGAAAGAAAEQEEQDAGIIGAPEHEQPGQHGDEQRDQPSIPSELPHRRPGPRGRSFQFRRVASMDSPSPVASAEEDEQAGGEKQGTGVAVCCEVSAGSDRLNRAAMKRSLSAGSRWTLLSRHCRARTSLLPL